MKQPTSLFGAAALGATALMIALACAPAHAGLVECMDPEPLFPYEDIGNDGCYNDGVDVELLAPDLLDGPYVTANSIVIPAGASMRPDRGFDADWTAHSIFIRGDVLLNEAPFSAEATTGGIEVLGDVGATGPGASVALTTSGSADIELAPGSNVSSSGAVIVGTNVILGLGARVTSSGASATVADATAVGDGARVSAATSAVLSTLGSITFGIGVRVTAGTTAAVGSTEVGPISVDLGEGFNVRADAIVVDYVTGGTVTAGEKTRLTAADGSITVAAAGDLTLSARSKLSARGGSVDLIAGGSLDIGEKASISGEGIDGMADGAITIAAKSKLRGGDGDIAFASVTAGDVSIGDKSKISGTGLALSATGDVITAEGVGARMTGAIVFGGTANVVIGPKNKIVGESVDIDGDTTRTVGTGSRISALGGACTIGSTGTSTLEDAVRILGDSVSFTGGSVLTGTSVSVAAVDGTLDLAGVVGNLSGGTRGTWIGDPVIFNNDGTIDLGDDSSVVAPRQTITFGNNGALTTGIGVTIDGDDAVTFSNVGTRTFGDATSLLAEGPIAFTTDGAISFGERTKMEAIDGGISLDAGTGADVFVGGRAKITATGKILFAGDNLELDAGGKLTSTQSALDSMEFAAGVSLDIQSAKLTGVTFTFGDMGSPISPINVQGTAITGPPDVGASASFGSSTGACDVTGTTFTNVVPTFNCQGVNGL